MATTITDRLAGVHPKMLWVDGEGDRKKLAERRVELGRSVERAFEILGITKQDAAFRMGYRDQGAVSRWCSANERPLFDKLFAIDGFEEAWMRARAERNPRLEIETVIRIRQKGAA